MQSFIFHPVHTPLTSTCEQQTGISRLAGVFDILCTVNIYNDRKLALI